MMRWGEHGMHWRDSKNDRLRHLAEWQVLESNPDLMYAEDEPTGVLSVTFGSRWAEMKLRDPGYEASSVFLNGHCIAMAIALHDILGYPFAVFTADSPYSFWQGHVGLLLDEEIILDFSGKNSIKDIHRNHRLNNTNPPAIMTREELIKRYVDSQNHENPLDYLDELEQLITRDFAEWIVEEHSITPSAVEVITLP